jgi:hypothetical protein
MVAYEGDQLLNMSVVVVAQQRETAILSIREQIVYIGQDGDDNEQDKLPT